MIDPFASLPGVGQSSGIETLVSMYMAIERRPMEALKESRDQLSLQTAVYSDLRTKLTELKKLAEDLSSSTDSVFTSHSVSPSDSTRVSAAASSSAVNGSYLIENVTLATTHRIRSAKQATDWITGGGQFTLNGTSITVSPGETLVGIKNAINGASYSAGREVIASIVDNTLVLESKATGAEAAISASDASGTVFQGLGMIQADGTFAQPVLLSPRDATFTVNGISVTRSRNAGLDDVIGGVSLDLKGSWAVGDSATLQVTTNTESARTKVESFLQKLNSLADYLRGKSAVTKGADGNYTRGLLNGNTMFSGLRRELQEDLSKQVAGLASGSPSRLYEIGVEMDGELHWSISDSVRLTDWLSRSPGEVAALFGGPGGVATRVLDRLTPFVVDPVGDARSYLDQEQDGVNSAKKAIDDRISSLEERLGAREQQLRAQYTRLQSLIIESMQQQQQMQSIYGAGGFYA